jgi:outer membrane protein assembly factor BamE (lipoprotein component of BamABCDE complex)
VTRDPRHMNRLMLTVAVVIVVMLGLHLALHQFVHSPAIPPAKWEHLREGMTEGEVRRLLGDPMQINSEPGRVRSWVYGSRWKLQFAVVQFAPDGTVFRWKLDE